MAHITAGRLATRVASARHLNPLLRAWGLYRQRRALADLTPERLADVGLDARSARLEAARPVWDAPHHWKG